MFWGIVGTLVYALGVYISICLIEKRLKIYKKNHPDENYSPLDEREENKMIICMSLFSWISLLILILSGFCSSNDN